MVLERESFESILEMDGQEEEEKGKVKIERVKWGRIRVIKSRDVQKYPI